MNISKKLAVIAASGLATITVAGGAFAYFTATGTGSGSATVGTSSPWSISGVVTTGNGGVVLPGGGQQRVDYTINNDSAGIQNLGAVAVTVKTEPANPSTPEAEEASVLGAPNCLASWFDIQSRFFDGTKWIEFAPMGSYAPKTNKPGHVTIQMNNGGGAGVNQDACKGKAVALNIAAS